MKRLILLLMALPALAVAEVAPARMKAADIVILGEVHDNPAHHQNQARLVADLAPRAIVAEMLTPDQAEALARDPDAYRETWNASGWPDYDMYLPVFTATKAPIYGAAIPREIARKVYAEGVAPYFSGDVAAYGLDASLPDAEREQRLDLQFEAHCQAMPRSALGGMVDVQRLRDATLAKAAIDALDATGGPVVVITGNGHARKDWGVPRFLARVRPDLTVFSLGQSEDGVLPDGGYDRVLDAPAADRPDPCRAFDKPTQ